MSLFLDILFPKNNLTPLNLLPTQPAKHPQNSRLDGIVSIFKYHGIIKDTLTDFKFDFVSTLAPELIEIMSSRLQSDFPNILNYWHDQNFCLVPIPLHSRRQNWRGFNQSELIAVGLSKKLNLPINNSLLSRCHHTVSQSSLPKSARRQNISSAFKLNQNIVGNFILVDDVYTTGSTLNAAAEVFFSKSILWGLTIAG